MASGRSGRIEGHGTGVSQEHRVPLFACQIKYPVRETCEQAINKTHKLNKSRATDFSSSAGIGCICGLVGVGSASGGGVQASFDLGFVVWALGLSALSASSLFKASSQESRSSCQEVSSSKRGQ